MTPRRREEEGARLLSFWEPPDDAGAPIGCIATTFTFDAPFYEEHCLGRFAGMDTDPNEDQRGYLIEREERLSQIYACVLVDRAHVTAHRSLRWSLCPVAVPLGGIQHAKVSLLVWERRTRLLVGSANLTEPGYRSNFEQMASLDFTPEGDVPLVVLRDALDFLDRVKGFAVRSEGNETAGSVGALASFLRRVRRHVSTWADSGWAKGEPRAEFLGVQPGGPDLVRQLADRTWTGTGPDEVHVLSPFFDHGATARRTVGAIHDLMASMGKRTLRFFSSGRKLPDGQIELDLPDVLQESGRRDLEHCFHLVHSKDHEGEIRDLHAKSIWLQRADRAVCTVGSSNFTAQGLGLGARGVNIEANIAYVMSPSVHFSFRSGVAESWPENDELDTSRVKVKFVPEPEDRTPEHPEFDALPSAFGEALFDPRPEGGRLFLGFRSEPPKGFRVESLSGRTLLGPDELGVAEKGGSISCSWPEERPPSGLLVHWKDKAGQSRRGIWVVNVTDPALLAPPSELMHLTLEELIEVLTSARPLHAAVSAVLKRREAIAKLSRGPIVDPHKKVDTRNFLLRRVRMVSRALEGLRERLERPAFTEDALAWRLHGPVGPLALARRLAESEGQGAAFMIAEVALTIRQAELRALEASLGREAVRRAVTEVLLQLEAMAAAHPSPPNLAHYVTECFEAVRA